MGDPPIEYVWHDGPVSAGLPVTQVYGWLLCPATGRVLIQEQDDGTFSLPGGTPEPYDADRDATLTREAFEENQRRLARPWLAENKDLLVTSVEDIEDRGTGGQWLDDPARAFEKPSGGILHRIGLLSQVKLQHNRLLQRIASHLLIGVSEPS
jgi:hypothetical protein